MAVRRRVGILGGMGPEATVLLMQRVIERTEVADDQDHVPMLVDNNPQVPSRVKALVEGTGEDPGPVLAAMARGLEAGGAEALAMPCNTAHHYAPAIREAASIPFIDMIEAASDRLAETGAQRVGVLASPAVRLTGLYDAPLAARGMTPVHPDADAALLLAMRDVKVRRHGAARDALAGIATGLAVRGADALLVACTEFSIVAEPARNMLPLVDAIDVLAEKVVAFSCGPAKIVQGLARNA